MIRRRHILQYPDPRLRIVATPVVEVNTAVRRLIREMIEIMYAANGIGLAATQIDVHQRIVVADVSAARDQPYVLINPVIVERGGSAAVGEGCLSIPDVYARITRAEWITLRALDGVGICRELSCDGVLAMCLQHELDHLDGTLFIDYLHPKQFAGLTQTSRAQPRGQRRRPRGSIH